MADDEKLDLQALLATDPETRAKLEREEAERKRLADGEALARALMFILGPAMPNGFSYILVINDHEKRSSTAVSPLHERDMCKIFEIILNQRKAKDV